MSKHTPGPWSVYASQRRSGHAHHRVIGSDGNGICYAEKDDARLIAAAPDLLAACKSIVGVFESHDDVPIYVSKARAAIAKAEGAS